MTLDNQPTLTSALTAAFLLGIYKFLFFASRNLTMLEMPHNVFYALLIYVFIPVAFFLLMYRVLSMHMKGDLLMRVLTISFLIVFYLLFSSTLVALSPLVHILCIVAFTLATLFLGLHYKYLAVLLSFMSLMSLVGLGQQLAIMASVDHSWSELPDKYYDSKIQKPRNIYLIQPDSYVNTALLPSKHYPFDNSAFEKWLESRQFRVYENVRSNYTDTVTSNLALFTLRHHYYSWLDNSGEVYLGREKVAGKSYVVSFFKENGYKTFLYNATGYLTQNGCYYDYCHLVPNLLKTTFSRKPTYLDWDKNWLGQTLKLIKEKSVEPRFLFIENSASPAHIAKSDYLSKGSQTETEMYIDRLKKANQWIHQIIDQIVASDPDGLIVLLSDHGGYSGLDYARQSLSSDLSSAQLESIFSVFLAIRWPKDYDGEFDQSLKSIINVFRVMLAYLTEDEFFIRESEDDDSYLVRETPTLGAYKVDDFRKQPHLRLEKKF